MEIYEQINNIIKAKNISKKKFIERLLALDTRLKSTGENPLKSSIYAYLNNQRELKIELISYIAEALDVSEQELFCDNEAARLKYLRHIMQNPSEKEIIIARQIIQKNQDNTSSDNIFKQNDEEYNIFLEKLSKLLDFGSKPLIENFISKLEAMKKITLE